MPVSSLRVQLRIHRTRTGLTQGELARRSGVSRQAVVAIEAGRQVPSTLVALQLARALGCTVEDLFGLPSEARLGVELGSVGEGARTTRVVLGRVDGRWVAHPVQRADSPGDALLDGEIAPDGTAQVEPLGEVAELERNVLVAGCAPLLGLLAGRLGRKREDARATWVPAHSTAALELLAAGRVHVAGLHLASAQQPGGHAALAQRRFPGQATMLINLTRWRQGFVVAPGNPRAIHGVDDLLRDDVRVVRRDAGAGAQQLVEASLRARGLPVEVLDGALTVSGHAELARLVRLGLADVGVAIEAVALAEGLDFIPLAEERFDLILPAARLASPPVARLLELIDRPAFRADAGRIAGYDLSTAGHACTVPAA